jgi:predicted fused transcriptional regulator/phosphomethylpyrimidine kinase
VGLSSRLQKLQNIAARILMNLRYNTPDIEAINALGWESLETRRAKSKVKQMYKVLNDLA